MKQRKPESQRRSPQEGLQKVDGSILSVGVPVYNQVATIEATLNSLLDQAEDPREIVVSENHSTDGTADVVRGFEGRVRVVQPRRHLTMTENWNFTVRQLTGEWIALLSGDDLAYPTYVSELQEMATRHDDAVLLRSGFDLIDDHGVVLASRVSARLPRVQKRPRTLTEQLVTPRTSFSAFAARREAWEQVGGFDEQLRLFGDWAFYLSLAPLGSFVYSRERISGYRVHDIVDKTRARCLQEARDRTYIVMTSIPDAAEKLGLDPRSVVKRTRYLLFDTVDKLVRYGSPDDRIEALEVLREWSATLGEGPRISRALAGDEEISRLRLVAAGVRVGIIPSASLSKLRSVAGQVRALFNR